MPQASIVWSWINDAYRRLRSGAVSAEKQRRERNATNSLAIEKALERCDNGPTASATHKEIQLFRRQQQQHAEWAAARTAARALSLAQHLRDKAFEADVLALSQWPSDCSPTVSVIDDKRRQQNRTHRPRLASQRRRRFEPATAPTVRPPKVASIRQRYKHLRRLTNRWAFKVMDAEQEQKVQDATIVEDASNQQPPCPPRRLLVWDPTVDAQFSFVPKPMPPRYRRTTSPTVVADNGIAHSDACVQAAIGHRLASAARAAARHASRSNRLAIVAQRARFNKTCAPRRPATSLHSPDRKFARLLPLLSERIRELVSQYRQLQQRAWKQTLQRYTDAQHVMSQVRWFETVCNALPMSLIDDHEWAVGDWAYLTGFEGEHNILNGHRVQLLMPVKSPPRWDVALVDMNHKLRVPDSCLQATNISKPLMGGGGDRPARSTAGRHPAREQVRC